MAKKNGNGKNGDSVVNLGAGATFGASIVGSMLPFKTKPGIIGAAEGSKKLRKIFEKKGK